MFKILAYPPTLEQLRILEMFGLRGELCLSLLRLVTILIVLLAVWWWIKSTNKLAGILLLISPTFLIVALCFPLLAIKLGLVVLVVTKLKNNWRWGVLLGGLLLIFFNLLVLGSKPAILNKLSPSSAQVEVNNRFTAEDSLKTKIILPLWWRRIAYNKYFFTYKQIVAEVLPFFDLESVFFQEVTPTGQKSMVMFFWPEIFLLILGIYFFGRKASKFKGKFLLGLMTLALIDFIFSEGANFSRLYLVMLPLSLILAEGVVGVKNQKWAVWLAGLVLIYSWGLNFYDLNVRVDYWLDNRPLAFEFWYKNLKKMDLSKYKRIQITSMVGDSSKYCRYYLGKTCEENKFVFEGFDLKSEGRITPGVYAGFAGEFVGPKFRNDIASNWVEGASGMGLRLINKMSLRDTIAYRFGNDIGLLIKD